MFYKLGERTPKKGDNVFVADNAKVIGDVILEDESSVWFGVTLRGDNDTITIASKPTYKMAPFCILTRVLN